MRRVLTAASLCVAAFAVLGGCQAEPPSKPCACPKGTGCQCPLPGTQHGSGGANQGGAKMAKPEEHVAQREHHKGRREARAEHERHMARRGAQREAREEEQRSGREASRFYGGYGYHSESHAYSMREGSRTAEGYGSEEEYAYGMHRHSHHRHRYAEGSGSGQESDEGGPPSGGEAYGAEGEQDSGPPDQAGSENSGRPEGAAPPEAEAAGISQMSINAPAALDSWHGYGVDCPQRDDDGQPPS